MNAPVRLADDQLEELAQRIAVVLEGRRQPDRLLTVAQVADALAVSASYVYEHATELGATRLPGGPNAPLRFPPAAALGCYGNEQSQAQNPNNDGASRPAPSPRRRSLATHRPKPGSIVAARPLKPRRA